MTVDRTLLARYLRQRRELGKRELFLEEMTAAEARTLVASGGGGSPGGSASCLSERSERVLPHPERGPTAGAKTAHGELRVLAEEATGCTRCRLHENRENVVFGEGSATADVVVVGEAPGRNEDRTGRPFVGRAGKLLDRLLLSAGLPREDIYICNVIKCRPPNNRDPKSDEVECCSSYLHGQLELIAPRVLLTVGTFATQELVGTTERIGRLRGGVHEYRGVPLVATYHPAYLLRSPRRTRVVWRDFQLMREVLDEHE